MKGRKLAIYYMSAWLIYWLYIYLDNVVAARGSQPYVWSHQAASFAGFSFCFFAVYPRNLRPSRVLFLVAGLLGAGALFMLVRYGIEELLYLLVLGHHNYFPGTSVIYYIGDNWWKALQPILLSLVIWSFLDMFNREKESERLRREKTMSELAFLRSQINPHFLYNTLNYIYYLAYPLSDQLGSVIIKLSGLMRYMLEESADGLVDLAKEVEYLHNYIELYRLRFEDCCFVEFDIDGEVSGRRIASLMLIPFVENAFKHGVLDDPANPVSIRLKISGPDLLFRVDNRINHNQKDPSSGIGLTNIRRRLELLYHNRYQLTVLEKDAVFHTSLSINFDGKMSLP